MSRYLLIVCLFLSGIARAGAAADVPVTAACAVLPVDTSSLVVKEVPADLFATYLNDNDFVYTQTQPVVTGFWDKIWNEIADLLRFTIDNNLFSWTVFLAFFVVFVLLMVLLIGGDFQTLFSRNKTAKATVEAFADGDIEAIDFDALVARELEKGNLNLAVRYSYLKLLQVLSHRQLIVWQKDKTNRQYVQELGQQPYVLEFKHVTHAYEYVWYGKFQISVQVFGDVRENINQLIKQING